MPQELYGRFSSKADFIRYFKEQRKYLITLITRAFSATVSSTRIHVEQRFSEADSGRRKTSLEVRRGQTNQRASLRRIVSSQTLANGADRRAINEALPIEAAKGSSARPPVFL